MPRELMPCPSLGARDRHRRNGETVCDECQEFWLAYLKRRRENPEAARRRVCPTCGRGMNQNSEELCSRCRKRHGKRPPCGTIGGYVWHTRTLHEKPCDACRIVRNERRSGKTPKCLNPGCSRRVYKKKEEYCALCRRSSIIGWMTIKGVRKPIYYRKEAGYEQKAG
jgi:hypothetical protein